jgi:endonuclease/exonuclease/phosphatase family metal-dependent hydrolase
VTAGRGLVVATWNIRAAIGTGPFPSFWWRHIDRGRLAEIGAFIASLDADVVALQEVGLISADGVAFELPGDLARMTGMEPRYAAVHTFPVVDATTGARTGAGLWGNAILSRHPLAATAAVALPGAEDDELVEPAGSRGPRAGVRYADAEPGAREARCAVRCDVAVAGLGVTVVSTHLTYAGSGQRERQARTLAAIAGDTTGPVVIAGDLNAPIEASELAVLRDGLVDAFEATGTPPGDRNRQSCGVDRIDHVLVRGLVPRSCRVAREAGDLSDHWPVIATFEATAQGRTYRPRRSRKRSTVSASSASRIRAPSTTAAGAFSTNVGLVSRPRAAAR